MKLTKEERNLLLFLEYTAVDQWGWVKDIRHLNAGDLEIMKQWNKSGFVLSKRAHKSKGKLTQLTYVVKLSPEAWGMAHKLRREKAERHIPEKFNKEKI